MFKLDLEKAEEPAIKLPTSVWLQKKLKNSRKTSALLTMLKPLTVWITTNCGKFFKRWEYQTTLPASCETCMWVKKQQLEPVTEQRTVSKLGKEYVKAVYRHPAYLTSMQSISGWMKHKMQSRLQEKYQQPQICRWHHPPDRKRRGSKEPLDEGERRMKKLAENSTFKKEDPSIQLHHFMANWWGNNGNSDRLYFCGLRDHCRWWLQPWN